ncbi:glutaredoxin domain-containing protein [Kribbella sp. DT2]|uniref:glutaredoxin domain-containing protein n=1 Tax=Kribbella sp. DT2 TaxID=3393427 RepID=UPI003CF824E2
MGIVELVLFGVIALVFSPLVFPRSLTDAEAGARSAETGRPIVYWRPGCQFCLRLRLKLGRRGGTAYWVNIWSDPAAAATVRSIAQGNETVPTVVAGPEHRVNPDPRWVRDQLH